jgi:hypothetical protein
MAVSNPLEDRFVAEHRVLELCSESRMRAEKQTAIKRYGTRFTSNIADAELRRSPFS